MKILDVLNQSVKLNGPPVYLRCKKGSSSLAPQATRRCFIEKGWSFSCWMRLHEDQVSCMYDILKFQNLSSPSHGINIGLTFSEMEDGKSLSKSFTIRSIPMRSRQLHSIKNTPLAVGEWHFVVFSHNRGAFSSKNGNYNFQSFIDGEMIFQMFIPYPNVGNELMSVCIGGFRGDLGSTFLFETAIDEATVK